MKYKIGNHVIKSNSLADAVRIYKKHIADTTRQEIINKIRNVHIGEGERWTYGDEHKGWLIDIQNHGSSRYEDPTKYRHVSPKEESSAWGRLWYDGKIQSHFEGPLNVVRDKMIKYLASQTQDSIQDSKIISPLELKSGMKFIYNGTIYLVKKVSGHKYATVEVRDLSRNKDTVLNFTEWASKEKSLKLVDSVEDDDIEELSDEERQAIEDYKAAIANTKDPKLLQLFSHILKEEIEHLEELQNEKVEEEHTEDSVKDANLTIYRSELAPKLPESAFSKYNVRLVCKPTLTGIRRQRYDEWSYLLQGSVEELEKIIREFDLSPREYMKSNWH